MAELGPFVYEEDKSQNYGKTEKRPKIKLDNGAIYEGEWLVGTEIKQGKGKFLWPDGSVYEGYWKDGKANGKGRLVHSDGDIYIGEWKNDKADGYGRYMHADDAEY